MAKYAPTYPGNVQGAVTTTLDTKLALIANHETVAITIGATTNGIINIGFNTIGAPNIIGSFILNIAGITVAFLKTFHKLILL